MTAQLIAPKNDDSRLDDLKKLVIIGRANGGALSVTLTRDSDKPEDNPFTTNYERRAGGLFDRIDTIEAYDNADKHAAAIFDSESARVDFYAAPDSKSKMIAKVDSGVYVRTSTMTKRVDESGKAHDTRDIRIDVTNLLTFVSRKPQKASSTTANKVTALDKLDSEIASVKASLAACEGVKGLPAVVTDTFKAQIAALTERRADLVKKIDNLKKARDTHATQPAAPVVSPGNNVVDASRKSASETRKSAHKPA